MLTDSQKHRIGTAAKATAAQFVEEFGLEELRVQGDWDVAAYSCDDPGWPDEAWPFYQSELVAEILRLQEELEKENETVEIGEGVYEAADGTVVYTSLSNSERAEFARNALDVFVALAEMFDTEREYQLSDLLCDLMHFCDEEKIDWNRCVARAQDHYTEEVREAETDENTR